MTLIEDIAANLKLFNKEWATVADFLKKGISFDNVIDELKEHLNLEGIIDSFSDNILDPIFEALPSLEDITDWITENIDLEAVLGSFDFETAVISPITSYIQDSIELGETVIDDIFTKMINNIKSRFDSISISARGGGWVWVT